MQPRILYVEDDHESRDIMRVLVNRVMGIPDLEIFEDSSSLKQQRQQGSQTTLQ